MKFSPRAGVFVESDLRETADPKLELISGTPHSAMLRESQKDEERKASMRQGMPPFLLSDSPEELSGKAMKIAMTELIERRQDDAMLFEAYERKLYKKTVIVVNHESRLQKNKALPNDADFVVNFGEQAFSDDPKAEYEMDVAFRDDNLLSTNDLYRKWVNPDAEDEEEISQVIASNKAINGRNKLPVRATPTDVNAQRQPVQQ
jgi:hypothetical protein